LVSEQISLTKAVDSFSEFDCISPDNSKEVSLYPGFIALEQSKLESLGIDEIINKINQCKSSLELFLQFYNKPKQIALVSGPVVKVNPILFEAYPMVNPAQLLRKVQLISSPVEKVHFKWQKRQRYDKKSIEEAINIAKFNMDKPPALEYSTQLWSNKIHQLIEQLDSLEPSMVITRIKPSPYTPQVAVKLEGIKSWSKYHGSMPLILPVNNSAPLIQTSELTDLVDGKKVDSAELESLGWIVISKELGFYYRK
jgi:hypothetical protein